MSSRDDKPKAAKATRKRRSQRQSSRSELYKSSTDRTTGEKDTPARVHYQREKARRAEVTRPPDHPLEQARRAYEAQLAADAAARKGGRPKKTTPKKPSARHGDESSDDQ